MVSEKTNIEKISYLFDNEGSVIPVLEFADELIIGGERFKSMPLSIETELVRDLRSDDAIAFHKDEDGYHMSVYASGDRGGDILFKEPDNCPACGTQLLKKGMGFGRCYALDCPAQMNKRIINFFSYSGLPFENKNVKRMVLTIISNRTVDSISSLFNPDYLRTFKKFSSSSVDTFLSVIKERPIHFTNIISGLRIPEITPHAVMRIEKSMRDNNINNMLAVENGIYKLDDTIHWTVLKYFCQVKNNKEELQKLVASLCD